MGLREKEPLKGQRWILTQDAEAYPKQLLDARNPPSSIYGIGDPTALVPGLAIVGARKATPYGLGCAQHFAALACRAGVCVVSGGARGCDAQAHRTAVENHAKTVVVLGGGCDKLYPSEHRTLFQRVIDEGGAVISEQSWEVPPLPFMFRERNRIIAGLSQAILIVEAGLPSGTFSTADEALSANRDVLAIPGAITSGPSKGANRLIYQGAIPIIDDDTFEDQLFMLFGALRAEEVSVADGEGKALTGWKAQVLAALKAEPLSVDELLATGIIPPDQNRVAWVMVFLTGLESAGFIERGADGRYRARIKGRL